VHSLIFTKMVFGTNNLVKDQMKSILQSLHDQLILITSSSSFDEFLIFEISDEDTLNFQLTSSWDNPEL